MAEGKELRQVLEMHARRKVPEVARDCLRVPPRTPHAPEQLPALHLPHARPHALLFLLLLLLLLRRFLQLRLLLLLSECAYAARVWVARAEGGRAGEKGPAGAGRAVRG
eukprot:3397600-Rhodomonas_salina.1